MLLKDHQAYHVIAIEQTGVLYPILTQDQDVEATVEFKRCEVQRGSW